MGRRHGTKLEIFRVQDASGITHVIQVYYRAPATYKTAGTFWLEADLGNGIMTPFEDRDLGILRQKVEVALKDVLSLEWKSMLLVSVGNQKDSRGSKHEVGKIQLNSWKFNLEIDIDYVEVGSSQNKVYHRQGQGSAQVGLPHIGRWDTQPNGMERTTSMIADTPENRATLNMLLEQMQRIGNKLNDLMCPAKIEASMASILTNSLLQLPANKE